jgi:Winged helix DNA-binding domain
VTERVLSTLELNRAMLARQLLLKRARMPIPRAIERVAGLQTQYAPSGYISLWSRLQGFRRDHLTRALEQSAVIQGWVMRSTIHMVSAGDYWPLNLAVRRHRREWQMRAFRKELAGVDMEEVAARVRDLLKDGPRKGKQMQDALLAEGYPRVAWLGSQVWVDVVRVPPSGTWERKRGDLFALAEDWVGPEKGTEAQALRHLIRRYFQGFGPASLSDLSSWAGIPVTALRPVVEKLGLRRFRDADGGELLDLPRQPIPDPDVPAPPRFIPTFEATLLAQARRTQFLPEEHRSLVFGVRTPHSSPTFTVEGQIAGKWRYKDGRVKLEPFAPIPRSHRRDLEAEADRLAAFHAD